MLRVLLILPPFMQLNTPYPATAYLTGFLRQQGREVFQRDAGIETALKLFCRKGIEALFEEVAQFTQTAGEVREEIQWFLAQRQQYCDTIDAVIRFLQNRDLSLAHRICHSPFLPEGPRFEAFHQALGEEDWAFGPLGITDKARHLCTLYLDDLSDLITGSINPHFGLTRYGEHLAASAVSYDPLHDMLAAPPGLIDRLLGEVIQKAILETQPDLVGFTVPFPGNLYGALRAAWWVKQANPSIFTVLGGGYVNTELRHLHEPRLFDVMDFVTLDDGERPLLCLLDHLEGKRSLDHLKRTFVRAGQEVLFLDGASEHDIPQGNAGTPTYVGLPITQYLSVLEVLNPMHRLWSDGRWNKLTLAHGCYWKKCSFCDVTLDYIGRYDPTPAIVLVDRMETLIEETGQSGFHFVDEAAPPLLLRDVALELLERGTAVSWWGNIRFEKTFSPDLCRLLAAAGCIAVSGGLEVASDRLLERMKKGVTVEQVGRVAQAFTAAGVMVHAYLMYGFPTQTAAETVDSLERVRQLFEAGVLQSAFWHRFVATRHAPVGQDPAAYGITITGPALTSFATNDLVHADPQGCDPEAFGPGLDLAVRNYMLGQGLELDVRKWFTFKVGAPKVAPDLIQQALEVKPRPDLELAKTSRLVWLGGEIRVVEPERGTSPSGHAQSRKAEGDRVTLQLDARASTVVTLPRAQGEWLQETLNLARPRARAHRPYETLEQALMRYSSDATRWSELLRGKAWKRCRELGALLV